MIRRLPSAIAWVLALLCSALVAAPVNDAAERARIAADRRAVEARYDAARKDCQARFVVNPCLDQARQARRAALEPLQRQTHLLDDARRRERAVERLRVIEERQATAAERPALAMPMAADNAASAVAPPPVRRAVRPATSASAAAQAAQQRQAQQQQRLKDAQAHQEAVQARNARRDAQRPPAAGLPVPGASAP